MLILVSILTFNTIERNNPNNFQTSRFSVISPFLIKPTWLTAPSAGEIIFPSAIGVFLSGSLKNQRIKNVNKKLTKDNKGQITNKINETKSEINELARKKNI